MEPTDNLPVSKKILGYTIKVLHWLVVLASAGLVVYITRETLDGISFLSDKQYLTFQFWACLLFIVDIFFEFIAAPKKFRYIATHIFFILISIPYLNIISHFHIYVSHEVAYVLHFIPMIRAGYILAVVTGALTSNDHVKGMFFVYALLMISSIYFCSLVFYIEEHPVNPGVTNFWMALWWAVLDATTVGSNINSVTVTGQALDVFLSAGGLILFPLFTVYVTNILSRGKTPEAAVNTDSPDDKNDAGNTEQDTSENATASPASA